MQEINISYPFRSFVKPILYDCFLVIAIDSFSKNSINSGPIGHYDALLSSKFSINSGFTIPPTEGPSEIKYNERPLVKNTDFSDTIQIAFGDATAVNNPLDGQNVRVAQSIESENLLTMDNSDISHKLKNLEFNDRQSNPINLAPIYGYGCSTGEDAQNSHRTSATRAVVIGPGTNTPMFNSLVKGGKTNSWRHLIDDGPANDALIIKIPISFPLRLFAGSPLQTTKLYIFFAENLLLVLPLTALHVQPPTQPPGFQKLEAISAWGSGTEKNYYS